MSSASPSPPKLVDGRSPGHQNSLCYTPNKKNGDTCYCKCVHNTYRLVPYPSLTLNTLKRCWRHSSRPFQHTSITSLTTMSAPALVPWMWNQNQSVLAGLPRSRNIAEVWHNGLVSRDSVSKPTI